MAKHKRSSGHRKKKIPILATGGAVLQGLRLYSSYNAGATGRKGNQVLSDMGIATGQAFNIAKCVGYWSPVLIGAGGSAVMSKLGFNRYMAKVPIFGL